MDEDGWAATQDAIQGSGANAVDVHVRGGGVQLSEDADASAANGLGRSVSGPRKTGVQTHAKGLNSAF